MPPKIVSKMFRKGKSKGKAKTKQKQVVNVKVNIDQSKRTVQRQPSANIAKKGGQSFRTLPAFSAAPQGFAGGGVQGPAVVVQPMPQPVQQQDTTTQALTAYNNLLLQSQAQQNAWRNMGGLNIQPNFGGLRQSRQEENLFNPNQVPYDYYRNSAGVVEEVVDDLTYDDPMTNGLSDNRLEYAPQLPDLTASASSSGLVLEEQQDNALSNLVSKEQLSQKEKQVENDLNNIDEEQQFQEIQVPVKAPKKKKIFITEEDEELSSSSSAPAPAPTPKRGGGPAAVRFNTEWEVANITNLPVATFIADNGVKMRYLTGLPANSVYDTSIGKIINKDSTAYKKALAQGYAEDIYTTDLGRIHRLRKSGAFSKK
jgi:hypothetical protein